MFFFQCEKSIKKQRDSSIRLERSGSAYKALQRRQIELSSALFLIHRSKQASGHGVFNHRERSFPPVRSDQPIKGMAHAGHPIAFPHDVPVELLDPRNFGSQKIFEIVVKIEDKGNMKPP